MKCCEYTAGMLRNAVTIQAKTRTADGMGGFTETWAEVVGSPNRAQITAAPGNERWGYMRQVAGNTYKMITRHFDSATAAQRVLCGGKEYGVLGVVDPDMRGNWLEWRLSDGVAS